MYILFSFLEIEVKLSRNLMVRGLVLLAAISLTASAWGHASARRSSPEDGAVLTESPTEISIQFNGPAKLISLSITNAESETTKVDVSKATSVDGLATVAILPL